MKYKTVTIVIIALFLAVLLAGQFSFVEKEGIESLKSYSSTRSIMDTTVTITVFSYDGDSANASIIKAFERIEHVNKLMNYYDNNSELSLLNRQGYIDGASPDLVYVINMSKQYSKASHGAFDVSILPILNLWKSKFAPGGTRMPPSQDEINDTLLLVNSSAIRIDGNDIMMEKNMSLTLGGIAKGYAVDLAIASLIEDGINSCFVNAGGDGRYIGLKADGNPWKVGLQDPEKKDKPIVIMDMRDMAVATSGNYERYFNESAKVSHISDPRTGYPSKGLISATIIARTAMEADAYATALFVMGEKDGLEMIEGIEGVECLIITNDKRIVRSSEFHKFESKEH